MTWWEYALLGGLGGLTVEANQFYQAMRRHKGWPWSVKGEAPPLVFVFSVVIRVVLGIITASLAGTAGQISGAIGAFGVGAAAPLFSEQIIKQVRLSDDRDSAGTR